MAKAVFRFYAELNYFLPPDKKNVDLSYEFKDRPSVKDAIEALGVPHPEVDCIVVADRTVNFSYILTDGDRLQVYPLSTTPNLTPLLHLCPFKPEITRFILDVHLGKLASSLRLLGFDTLYRNDYDDAELAQISATEARILLTRDKGLLMRSLVAYGYYIRTKNPDEQIVEVLQRFDLWSEIQAFKRCIRCNGLLKPVDKATILDRLPTQTQLNIDRFHQCQDCQQVYWRGAHYERMQQFIEKVKNIPRSQERF